MYQLTIMHHNIRGLNDKLSALKIIIEQHNPDIITLNETLKIKPKTKIPNYTITQPQLNTGQGVAIIHKNNINVDILPQITTKKPTDNLHQAILIHTPTDTIQIATIYCPRKNPSIELLKHIMTRQDKTIFTGDFNSKHEDFGHDISDPSGRTLVNITNNHTYTKLNDNEPTYTNDHSGKQDVKDLIFSSPTMFKTFREFWVDEDLGSDHNTIFATFSHKQITHTTPKQQINLYHQADWNKINDNISTAMNTNTINHKSTTHQIDTFIQHLTTTINNNIKDNVKSITINSKSIGLPNNIRQLIQNKRKERTLFKRTRDPKHKTEYNRLNNQIKALIKIEKQNN